MISFNIDINQLQVINRMMAWLDDVNFASQPRQYKSMVAICTELREILLKRAIDKRLSQKRFKLKLSYYKADALFRFLSEFEIYFEYQNEYDKNVVMIIKNDLHQKLL